VRTEKTYGAEQSMHHGLPPSNIFFLFDRLFRNHQPSKDSLFFPIVIIIFFSQKKLRANNKFRSTEKVVIFVSAVIYNETQENSAALSHIQLCIPL